MAPFASLLLRARRDGRELRGHAEAAEEGAIGARATRHPVPERPTTDPSNVPPLDGETRDALKLDAERNAERPREELDSAAVGADAPLDSMFQILVPLAPRCAAAAPALPPPESAAPLAATPMEQLMNKLVRRVAWSGQGRTGTARLELGAGALEGATLTVHADDGAVRVSLDLPPGVDGAAWRDRIAQKLDARGLRVEALEIT